MSSQNSVAYEQEELLCSTIEIFQKITSERRRQFILSILRLSDPSDMNFIYERLPRMHRDFIRLLPPGIAHQIVTLVHPRDICEMATCCHAWRDVMKSPELWKLLYKNIGLNSMLNQYFNVESPIKVTTLFHTRKM
jgi:hypothetical protein